MPCARRSSRARRCGSSAFLPSPARRRKASAPPSLRRAAFPPFSSAEKRHCTQAKPPPTLRAAAAGRGTRCRSSPCPRGSSPRRRRCAAACSIPSTRSLWPQTACACLPPPTKRTKCALSPPPSAPRRRAGCATAKCRCFCQTCPPTPCRCRAPFPNIISPIMPTCGKAPSSTRWRPSCWAGPRCLRAGSSLPIPTPFWQIPFSAPPAAGRKRTAATCCAMPTTAAAPNAPSKTSPKRKGERKPRRSSRRCANAFSPCSRALPLPCAGRSTAAWCAAFCSCAAVPPCRRSSLPVWKKKACAPKRPISPAAPSAWSGCSPRRSSWRGTCAFRRTTSPPCWARG